MGEDDSEDLTHGILNPGDIASHEQALLVEERHLFLYETSVLPETYGQLTNLTTYMRNTRSLLEEFAKELEKQIEQTHRDLSAPNSVLQEKYEPRVAVVEQQLIQTFLHVDELEHRLLLEPSSAITILAAKVVQLEKKLALKASFKIPNIWHVA
ncbi:hypothetical protein L0F63_001933 [Massospora cicadina]|nr:hypothetical protein L0F63_001933 [Massospora cicadina]